jgi:hypothetical protein
MARPPARPTPPRAARRARAREHEALVREIEQLASREPGGSPGRPLGIDSPAQVEVIALSRACPLCQGTFALEAHDAVTEEGARLRVARVRCTACGVRRALYFRLAEHLQS